MTELIILMVALCVLVIAGVILSLNSKNNDKYVVPSCEKPLDFESKYDEVVFLYKSGKITKDEYQKRMMYIIN